MLGIEDSGFKGARLVGAQHQEGSGIVIERHGLARPDYDSIVCLGGEVICWADLDFSGFQICRLDGHLRLIPGGDLLSSLAHSREPIYSSMN